MKRVLITCIVMSLSLAAPAFAADCLCVNPTFTDGTSNGWTQWQDVNALGVFWSVTNVGPLGPEATVGSSRGAAGYYQSIPANIGQTYDVDGFWASPFLGGAVEVLLFSDNGSGIVNQIMTPVNAIVARRANLGGALAWESILDPAPIAGGQIGGNSIVATTSSIVVAMKLDSAGTTTASFDSICVTPEPITGLLLCVPALAVIRRRAKK